MTRATRIHVYISLRRERYRTMTADKKKSSTDSVPFLEKGQPYVNEIKKTIATRGQNEKKKSDR